MKIASGGNSIGKFRLVQGINQVLCYDVADGDSLVLEVSPDGGTTWVATDVAFTEEGIKTFYGSETLDYRMSTADASKGEAVIHHVEGNR